MKRICILTQYHNTTNYGGALQAYALCRVLNSMGYVCEQLDIDFTGKFVNLNRKKSRFSRFLKPVKLLYAQFLKFKCRKMIHQQKDTQKLWEKAFYDFTYHKIPHSKRQYNQKNVAECVRDYDVFIVGSDQVWNPLWYYEPFFLTFVPEGKKKISYAASISQAQLSDQVKEIYAAHLKTFDAVSVREYQSVELLTEFLNMRVEQVLDPTLLLAKNAWLELVSERMIDSPYVLCYFLGNDGNMRQLAKQYAKQTKKILVNIKNATAILHTNDIQYGDIALDAPSPDEFLSLIKFADVVFTDSFHACVFSIIFEKQFWSFSRFEFKDMSSRMETLMQLFGLEKRYLGSADMTLLNGMLEASDIDYALPQNVYEEKKQASYDYLRRSIDEHEQG